MPIQAVTVRTEKRAGSGQGAEGRQAPPGGRAPGRRRREEAPRRREPMQKVVFVVEDGKARVRRVETGLASENDIEIVSGLKEGEEVVEGPYQLLSRELADGKPVKEAERASRRRRKAAGQGRPRQVSGDAKRPRRRRARP